MQREDNEKEVLMVFF